MSDYLAAVIVIAVVIGVCWLLSPGTWRKCKCGAQYCNTCNAKRSK